LLKVGIVGLPNVGKSTLFNALLKKQVAASANYPFTTIDPNIGVVEVPDDRLEKLAKVVNTEKIVPAVVEFVDIAGLVKNSHKGEGLGNQFLSHIREVDAIAHVIRVFDDPNVVRSDSSTDPKSDIETINLELILADLETINKLIDSIQKDLKAKVSKEAKGELEVLARTKENLDKGILAKETKITHEESSFFRRLPLLTIKPVIYVFNVSEKQWADENIKEIANRYEPSVIISAKMETEINSLSKEDQVEYLKSFGLDTSGLERFIQASYKLLGLITYFTAGEKKVRAWTIVMGAKAPEAAGVIHTDFEKGFIKAEVVDWKKLVEAGSWKIAYEKGLVRLEGRNYIFQDGDVTEFKFNVN
jgi:GTP-binding protein YchF